MVTFQNVTLNLSNMSWDKDRCEVSNAQKRISDFCTFKLYYQISLWKKSLKWEMFSFLPLPFMSPQFK